MKEKITVIILLVSFSISAQQQKKWLDDLENPKFESRILKNENLKLKYLNYDFSTLMVPREKFLGYIGNEYERIRVYFISINKDTNDQSLYNLTGASIVQNNICKFKGSIKIQQIREYKSLHTGLDDNFKNSGIKAQGLLIGDYEFREDSTQKHSGLFNGVITLYWYLDKYEVLQFDNLEWFSDRYSNNQYVGTWTSYSDLKPKICNWGESRIPFSNDLDFGAAEFSPNPKYLKSGWEDYKPEKGE